MNVYTPGRSLLPAISAMPGKANTFYCQNGNYMGKLQFNNTVVKFTDKTIPHIIAICISKMFEFCPRTTKSQYNLDFQVLNHFIKFDQNPLPSFIL